MESVNNGANLVQLQEFQDEVLMLLNSNFNLSGIASYLVDDSGQPLCYHTSKIAPVMHRQYTENFYKEDPMHPTRFTHKEDRIVKLTDVIPPARRRTSTFYCDFISNWNLRDIVELFFYREGHLIGGSALFFNHATKSLDNEGLVRLGSIHRYIEFSLNKQLQTSTKISYETFCQQYQLTNKEKVVLQLAIQGLVNKTMANNLNCSLPTIKTHLQHLFAKLGVNSKVEMVNKVYSANCIL